MPVGVAPTYDGTVLVADMDTGDAWEMSSALARAAADKCRAAAGLGTSDALVICDCLHDRQFRFAGDGGTLRKMADDLDRAAKYLSIDGAANDDR